MMNLRALGSAIWRMSSFSPDSDSVHQNPWRDEFMPPQWSRAAQMIAAPESCQVLEFAKFVVHLTDDHMIFQRGICSVKSCKHIFFQL